MNKIRSLYISAVALALVVGACAPAPAGSASQSQPTEAAMAEPTQGAMMNDTATPEAMMNDTTTPEAMMNDTGTPEAMMNDTATPEAMMNDTATPEAMMNDTATPEAMMANSTEGAMMAAPAWFGTTLTDVTTGKPFSIGGFKGKVVLVETMAQTCVPCKQQQSNIKAFLEKLGMPADLVTVSLDVDAKDAGGALKTYAAGNGFGWLYAVAPADVSQGLGKLYGIQSLDPASAPLLVIDQNGDAHPLPAGIQSADDLARAIDPYLKAM
jgi:thiol-disulfide isomerase/thioredoxin